MKVFLLPSTHFTGRKRHVYRGFIWTALLGKQIILIPIMWHCYTCIITLLQARQTAASFTPIHRIPGKQSTSCRKSEGVRAKKQKPFFYL